MNKDINSAIDFFSSGQKTAMFITVVGLNILFFVPFLFPFKFEGEVSTGVQRYIYIGFLSLLVGGFVNRIIFFSYRKNGFYNTWYLLLVTSISIMALQSIVSEEDALYIIGNCIIYFGIYLISFTGMNNSNWKLLNKVFLFHATIGAIYTTYYVLSGNISSREDMLATTGYSIFVSGVSYYSVPFLVLSYSYQTILGRIVTVLSYIAMAILFVLWQSRIGIAVLVGLPILQQYMAWRSKQISPSYFIRTVIILLFVCLSCLTISSFTLSGSSFGKRLTIAAEHTTKRFTGNTTVEDTLSNDFRWEEVRIVAQNLEWYEWVVGRGIAATWNDPRAYFGAERNMVHFAYMHYIFQGGFLLLFVMLVPIYWGIKSINNDKDFLSMVAGGYIVYQYAVWGAYGFPSMSLQWMLICLTIGRCSTNYPQKIRIPIKN